MNSIDFCFWLQGYFAISGSEEITPEQAKVIREHLGLVFMHEIDPLRESETPASASSLNQAQGPISPNASLIRC